MRQKLYLLLAILCFAGCAALYAIWTHTPQPPQAAFLCSKADETAAGLDKVCKRLNSAGYRATLIAGTPDVTAQAEGLIRKGVSFLVISADELYSDARLTDLCCRAEIPVLFIGEMPDEALLSGNDSVWFFGASASDAGELIGQQMAAAFRYGVVSDHDGDLRLDYLTVQGESYRAQTFIKAVVTQCEHHGIYTESCLPAAAIAQAPSAAETPLPADHSFAAEWSALGCKPEIILCSDYAGAVAAHQTAKQLNWLNCADPVQLAAVTGTAEQAKALSEMGFAAVTYLDDAFEMESIFALTVNVLEHRYISYNTSLRQSDDSAHFILPYKLWDSELSVQERLLIR
ncbi:MAG: hypothetical protein IJ347_02830 [Faecalibacterium sp.]|nr:hypothetical protein [Faecalibacterium sp.]